MLYNHDKPPPTNIFNHDDDNAHINGMHWPWARVTYAQVKSRRRYNVWNFMVSLCFSADKKKKKSFNQSWTNQNFAGRNCTWIPMSHLDCWESSRALVLHLNHQLLISNPAHLFLTLWVEKAGQKKLTCWHSGTSWISDAPLSTGGASTLLCVRKICPPSYIYPFCSSPEMSTSFTNCELKCNLITEISGRGT